MLPLPELKRRLASVLREFAEIDAAFLFGSVAEGRSREHSDIDIALVPNDPGLRARRLDILTALAKQGFDNIDLVVLDTDDVVLNYEAVRPNCLVYARKGFSRGLYYSRRVREYFDFLPVLNTQREAYKRRLQRGQR